MQILQDHINIISTKAYVNTTPLTISHITLSFDPSESGISFFSDTAFFRRAMLFSFDAVILLQASVKNNSYCFCFSAPVIFSDAVIFLHGHSYFFSDAVFFPTLVFFLRPIVHF